jgi:hypothetical protein
MLCGKSWAYCDLGLASTRDSLGRGPSSAKITGALGRADAFHVSVVERRQIADNFELQGAACGGVLICSFCVS